MSDKSKNTIQLLIGLFLAITMAVCAFILIKIDKDKVQLDSQNNIDNSQTTEQNVSPLHIKNISTNYNLALIEGDIINTENLTLKIDYADGTSDTISGKDAKFDENISKPLMAGDNTFSFSYDDNTYEIMFFARRKNAPDPDDPVVLDKYKDEIEESDYHELSENIFVTIDTRYTERKHSEYLLTHVIIKDNKQMKIMMANDEFEHKRERPTLNAKRNGWIIGINGSEFDYHIDQFPEGVYINNRKVYQDGPAVGTELCIDSDGNMFTPEKGETAESLLNKNVVYTLLSSRPTLIENGKKLPIDTNDPEGCKTAIGMISPNEYYLITTTDDDFITNIRYEELQEIFKDLGCSYAKCLAEDTNVSLIYNNKRVNSSPIDFDRIVFDFLVFYEK